MFLLLRCLLAHFIADFPLQTNTIYCLKVKNMKGQLLHAAIHTLTFMVMLLPFLNQPAVWLYLALITLSHLSCDIWKVRLMNKTNINPVFLYSIDQFFHLLFVSTIFFFPFAHQVPEETSSIWLNWFWNDQMIFFLIGLIVSSYFITYLLSCIDLKQDKTTRPASLASSRKAYGMAERGLIFAALVFLNYGYLWIIPILGIRAALYRASKNKGKEITWLNSKRDILIGLLITLTTYIILF